MSGERSRDPAPRRWVRVLWQPPWRRAPLRAWRTPSLFLGVAVAAFVLGLAGSSRPMFASSTARASLSHDVEEGCLFEVGFRAQRSIGFAPEEAGSSLEGSQLPRGTEVLDDRIGGIEGIDDAVVSVIGDPGIVRPTGAEPGSERAEGTEVMTAERTGFRDHIEVIDEAPGDTPGVWLPDTVVERIDVAAGDDVTVDLPGGDPLTLPVAGTFEDLRYGRDNHWCSMRWYFEPRTAGGSAPPPLLLFDEDVFAQAMFDAGHRGTMIWWEYPPDPEQWDLATAHDAIGRLETLVDEANNTTSPVGSVLGFGASSVDIPKSLRKAERTDASVQSVAGPVALGTIGVAVVMLLAAARSWLTRRAQEVTVLSLRGAGPVALALKAMAELLPALLLGAATGVASAVVVVKAIGPDARIDRAAYVEGVVVVAVALLTALAALAVVVAAGVRRVGVGAGGAAPRRSLPLWEPLVLVLAGAAYYELRTREAVVDGTQVDGLLLLFPLLLLAGGAGLAGRLLLSGRLLTWLAARLPTPGWLAARRLTEARLRAALIVAGVAISAGIVVFAGAMSASVAATAYAKATLGHGAAQIVRLSINQPPLDEPPVPGISTLVTRTEEEGVVRLGHTRSDVLGVDPDTFGDAALWDDSFSGRSLPGLLSSLGTQPGTDDVPEGAVPAIAVGVGLPDRFELALENDDGAVDLEVAIVGRADAFPGLGFVEQRPLVVVDRAALTEAGVTEHGEVWVDEESPTILGDLEDQGVQTVFAVSPGADVQGTLLQPQVWAIDYLEVVGLAAGLVTLAGLGLYFAANSRRRQLGAAMARRLGLPLPQAALATALEVLAIVGTGLVLGTGLSWLAMRLVFRNLDPLPNSAPDPLLRFDLGVVGGCAIAAALTVLLMTLAVERRTARASLPELLRDAG